MAFESDSAGSLPPLRAQAPPTIPVETLLTIETVTLAAGDVPWGTLREFYRRILGLRHTGENESALHFRHLNRNVVLDRAFAGPGQLGLLIRNFSDAIIQLKHRQVAHEVLHSDSGFPRTANFRDPAGNWIKLVETRPL